MRFAPWSRQRWSALRDAWRTRLWPVPTLGIVLSAVLGFTLPRVDAGFDRRLPAIVAAYLFGGQAQAARTVLGTIAGSLVTVTALTFSLTVITLQLASSQYSPRILRTFTRDRYVHGALTLLLSTFVYSVTVMRTVRSNGASGRGAGGGRDFVPKVSVTLAYLLAVASVIVLVLFLAHLARQIRVESMLDTVGSETVQAVRRVLREEEGEAGAIPPVPDHDVVILCGTSSGFLTFVDETALLDAVVSADAVVRLDRMPGDFLVSGTPWAIAWPAGGAQPLTEADVADLTRRAGAAIRTGFERTSAQDMAFGLRQIVDVAVKALSPGINDPTTAVHAIGYAAAVIRQAAEQDLGPRLLRDDAGQVRVIMPRPDLPWMLDLVMTQPRRYGAADPEVVTRLFILLREVAWATRREEHRKAVSEHLVRLGTAVSGSGFDPAERERFRRLAGAVRDAMAGRWPIGRAAGEDNPTAPAAE